jgi:hypothetical protein
MPGPTARGSKQKIRLIHETVFGTTPATPVMTEIPVNSFNKDVAINMIRSGQIRSHPFTDRLLQGAQQNDLELVFELQDDTHDKLLELAMGAMFTSNAVKATDALIGATVESEHNDLTLFDLFTGVCVRRSEFNFPAQADGLVTVSQGLMALDGLLDEGTSVADSTIAAPSNDPFVFHEAAVTIAAAARPVTALNFVVERQIDPLYVLGTRQPDEYIPAAMTLTGQITIPLRDATESTRLLGFTEAALVATCTKGAATRTFTIHKINYASMGRRINNRGAILQEINFEAKYSASDATIMTIARSA